MQTRYRIHGIMHWIGKMKDEIIRHIIVGLSFLLFCIALYINQCLPDEALYLMAWVRSFCLHGRRAYIKYTCMHCLPLSLFCWFRHILGFMCSGNIQIHPMCNIPRNSMQIAHLEQSSFQG